MFKVCLVSAVTQTYDDIRFIKYETYNAFPPVIICISEKVKLFGLFFSKTNILTNTSDTSGDGQDGLTKPKQKTQN